MIIRQIILHHTTSSRDRTTLNDVNRWHRTRFNLLSSLGFWIGYHYIILTDGRVIQTRRDIEIGAHAVPNEGRLGIALTGNFENERPSQAQLTSLENLLTRLKSTYQLTNKDILSHHQVSATLCAGRNLISWLENYKKKDLNGLQKRIFEIQKRIELLKRALEVMKGR